LGRWDDDVEDFESTSEQTQRPHKHKGKGKGKAKSKSKGFQTTNARIKHGIDNMQQTFMDTFHALRMTTHARGRVQAYDRDDDDDDEGYDDYDDTSQRTTRRSVGSDDEGTTRRGRFGATTTSTYDETMTVSRGGETMFGTTEGGQTRFSSTEAGETTSYASGGETVSYASDGETRSIDDETMRDETQRPARKHKGSLKDSY
jgi:hypothetical protein